MRAGTEGTVVRIDDDGNAYGAYCHRSSRQVRHALLDLHSDEHGGTASLDDETLRFEIGNAKWAFWVDAADPDVVRMAFRRKDTRELDLAAPAAYPGPTLRHPTSLMKPIQRNPNVGSNVGSNVGRFRSWNRNMFIENMLQTP